MKPGLYVDTVRGTEGVMVFRREGQPYWVSIKEIDGRITADPVTVTDARPLVVLDPESDEDCRSLMDAALAERVATVPEGIGRIRKILRALAVPKPDEPLFLGAVVPLSDGWLAVRISNAPDVENPWLMVDPGGLPHQRAAWARLTVEPGWSE